MHSRALARLSALVSVLSCSACAANLPDKQCHENTDCSEHGWGYICRSDRYCERLTCESTEECQQQLGVLASCHESGRCEQLREHEACSRYYPSKGEWGPDTVAIGHITDPNSGSQSLREAAARLAFETANGAGGLGEMANGGKHFGLVMCTHATDRSDVEEIAEYLSSELQVPAILGPATSSAVKLAIKPVLKADSVMVTPSATSVRLSLWDTKGVLWSTAPNDCYQVGSMVAYMKMAGIQRAAIIYDNDDYGEPFALAFSRQFDPDRETGKSVIIPIESDSSQRDVRDREISEHTSAAMTFLGTGSPDSADPTTALVFISAYDSDAKSFLSTFGELRKDGDLTLAFLTDGAAKQEVAVAAPPQLVADNVIRGTRPPAATRSDFVFDTFASRFGDQVNEDPFTAHAWDAAWLVIYGAAWSYSNDGKVSGHGIAEGLRDHIVNQGATKVDLTARTWQPDIFSLDSAVDLAGASGELAFNSRGELIGDIRAEIWSIATGPDGANKLELLGLAPQAEMEEVDECLKEAGVTPGTD